MPLSDLIKITTMIDFAIKKEYDLVSKANHKNYRDAIETGALEIISQYDPEKAAELRIKKLEQQLAEERQALANYQLIKQLKSNEKSKEPEQDIELEKMRNDLFREKSESLAIQVKNGCVNWKLISELFLFDTPKEARIWILRKLQELNSLGN